LGNTLIANEFYKIAGNQQTIFSFVGWGLPHRTGLKWWAEAHPTPNLQFCRSLQLVSWRADYYEHFETQGGRHKVLGWFPVGVRVLRAGSGRRA
jgi:hypothetical protein